MRDPTVVKDLVRLNGIDSETAQKLLQDLQGDVQQCVDCDQVYSPQADAKRLQLGERCLHWLQHMPCSSFLPEKDLMQESYLGVFGVMCFVVFCFSSCYMVC